MSAIDFVRSLYTVSDGNTLNGWSSSPSNGDTATANSQTYTYSSSRNLWVLATGVTNTITDGATYSWDGEKWIAQSHIPFRYFGPQASDPTGMSSDDAGDLYFNTTTDKLKVYTGSAWEDYSVPDDGSITPAKLSTGGPNWNTSGNVGIGTTSPSDKLSVAGSSSGDFRALTLRNSSGATNSTASLTFEASSGTEGNAASIAAQIKGARLGGGTTGGLQFWTANSGTPAERMRIDNSGRMLVGLTSARTDFWGSLAANVQVEGSSFAAYSCYATNGNGAFIFGRDNGSNGSTIGNLSWQADDGTDEVESARISAQIDGVPGSDDMPGRLTFHTTADGADSVTERMRIDSSGRVGIGTTPSGADGIFNLDINGTALHLGHGSNFDNYITCGSSGTQVFRSAGTERLRIDSSGRLLVGTSSARTGFASSIGTSPSLQVEGTSASTGAFGLIRNANSVTASPYLQLAKTRGTTNGSNTIVQSGDRLGYISFSGANGTDFDEAAGIEAFVDGTPGANDMPGRLVFSTSSDGSASPTERLRIDSSGNVGIGTTSPDYLLDIHESSSTYNYIHITSAVSGSATSDGILFGLSSSGQALLWNQENTPLRLATNNTERLRIDESGNVGIGTTSPSAPLHITNASPKIILTDSDNSADISISSFGGVGAYETASDSTFKTNSAERMRIDTSGRVGIGTTSPSVNLDISPSSGAAEVRIAGAEGEEASIRLYADQGDDAADIKKLLTDTSGNFKIQHYAGSSFVDSMVINSSGNVGIGTTSPNSYTNYTTLTVNGTTGGEVDFESSGTLKGQIYATSSSGFYVDSRGSTTPTVFKTNTSERMRIDSSGRVIIGQTSSQGSDSTLQVRQDGFGANVELFRSYDSISTPPRIRFSCSKGTNGSPAVVTSGNNLGEIRFNGYDGLDYLSQAAKLSCAVDGTASANDMPGRLEFYTTSDGSNTPTERMRINSSGRVGIGTSSINYLLTVLAGSGSQSIFQAGQTGVSNGYTISSNGSALTHQWYSSAGEAARIDSSGHVGIGTTSPVHTLQIHATNPQIRLQETSASSKRLDLFVDPSTALGVIAANQSAQGLAFQTTNSERMRIDSSGRVLIGGSEPGNSSSDELTLISTGHTGMTIRSGTSHAGSLFFSDTTSGAYQYGGFIQYQHSNNSLAFGANTNEGMRIKDNGFVGVGLTNPMTKFVVSDSGAGCLEFQPGSSSGYIQCYNRSTSQYMNLDFYAGTYRFRDTSGNITASVTGTGLTFNGDTADANALDDYEEGSFTPTWVVSSGTTPTATGASGRYTKIGNRVFFELNIATSAVSNSSALVAVRIGGLPFTAASASPSYGVTIGKMENFDDVLDTVRAWIDNNTTEIRLVRNSTSGAEWQLASNNLTQGSGNTLSLSGSYTI